MANQHDYLRAVPVASASNGLSGKLFLILGPSGSGKGTVIAHLRQQFPDAVFPLSCTTRPPRPGEHDGEVYHFVSKDEFEKRKDRGDFLEWALVHADNFYGTLKTPILDALSQGKMIIREVDMQGVISIRSELPRENVISIFLATPSWESLRDRIMGRHKETDEEIEQRRKSYEKEVAFSHECDYVVLSEDDKQDECAEKVRQIITDEFGA